MYQINNNDFKILSKYKIFLDLLDNLLENVPRKDLFFKDLIRTKAYATLELILECSYDVDNCLAYKNKIKANISMLDFLIDRLFTKHYVNEKATSKIINLLVEINKMVNGWINNMQKDAN